MTTFSSHQNLQLKKAFDEILSTDKFSPYIKRISELIYTFTLDKKVLDNILNDNSIRRVEDIKEEILDLLLIYINIVLNDDIITEREASSVKLLKKFFKIQEGDFYHFRYNEIQAVLNSQFQRIYANNDIDPEEAVHKVLLQELFDLSYDQFLLFSNKEEKAALQRGANIINLDTVIKGSDSTSIEPNTK